MFSKRRINHDDIPAQSWGTLSTEQSELDPRNQVALEQQQNLLNQQLKQLLNLGNTNGTDRKKQLKEAMSVFTQVDNTIVKIDNLLNEPISNLKIEDESDLIQEIGLKLEEVMPQDTIQLQEKEAIFRRIEDAADRKYQAALTIVEKADKEIAHMEQELKTQKDIAQTSFIELQWQYKLLAKQGRQIKALINERNKLQDQMQLLTKPAVETASQAVQTMTETQSVGVSTEVVQTVEKETQTAEVVINEEYFTEVSDVKTAPLVVAPVANTGSLWSWFFKAEAKPEPTSETKPASALEQVRP